MVAAVGSAPDRQLTLWDVATGAVLLRCHAHGQDVYGVQFCPHTSGTLMSCGTGHIRFWRVATTFTGLKLQGELGRFGTVELSDISAMLELPGGCTLTGSEPGALLVWQGGRIHAQLERPGGAPCHVGNIQVLKLHTATNMVLSAGDDGVVRLWDAARLEGAQSDDGMAVAACAVKPMAEVVLPQVGRVNCVLWEGTDWLVLAEGGLLRVALPLNVMEASHSATVHPIMDLHGGALLGAAACPGEHAIITAAGDGSVRVLQYHTGTILQLRRFVERGTSMAVLPHSVDPAQRTVLLGYANGVVRLVCRCSDGWRLLAASRPHKVGRARQPRACYQLLCCHYSVKKVLHPLCITCQ